MPGVVLAVVSLAVITTGLFMLFGPWALVGGGAVGLIMAFATNWGDL